MALFPIRDVEQLIFDLVDVVDLLHLVKVSQHCRKYVEKMPLFRCYRQILREKGKLLFPVACQFPYVQLYNHFFDASCIFYAFRRACTYGQLHLADRLLQEPMVRDHYRDYTEAIEEIYIESQAAMPAERSEEVLQYLCRYVLKEEYVSLLLSRLKTS